MSLVAYGNNLKAYLETLEPTNINIIYFDVQHQRPHIRTVLRKFKEDGHTFLANCGSNGLWVYTYNLNAMKYLFTRVDTDVQAFVGTITGGAHFDVASVGSHLTVGLIIRNRHLLMKSHYTDYIETTNFEFQIDRSVDCTLALDEITIIDQNTPCWGKSQTLGEMYKLHDQWISIIDRWRQAFLEGIEVHKGPRGGVFVMNGGKKRYLRKQINKLKGGVMGPALTDSMLELIQTVVVRPVLQHYKAIHTHIQAKLLYDQDNEFEAKARRLILIYEKCRDR